MSFRLWNHWDDLPETIVIGINQRNSRMEDCRLIKTTAYLPEKELTFFEFIGELPYIEKNTALHRLK
jgi:hypothetical protein